METAYFFFKGVALHRLELPRTGDLENPLGYGLPPPSNVRSLSGVSGKTIVAALPLCPSLVCRGDLKAPPDVLFFLFRIYFVFLCVGSFFPQGPSQGFWCLLFEKEALADPPWLRGASGKLPPDAQSSLDACRAFFWKDGFLRR